MSDARGQAAPPRRVVVDCDPGLDDVIALAVLAGDIAAERLGISAVMAVAGNVGRDRCAANARLALDRLGLADLHVHPGADRPIGGLEPVDAEGFHGGDGLAGLSTRFGVGQAPALSSRDPGATLAGLVRAAASEGTVDVLTLGPLTDLALALESDPALPEVIGRVVTMGGGFGTASFEVVAAPGPETADHELRGGSSWGNVTRRAEFNIHADPIAADRVFAAGLALTLVPLDVTRQVLLTGEDTAAAAAAGVDDLVVGLLRCGVERQLTQSGLPGMAAHDPVAALVLTEPDVVRSERRAVAVGISGEARGACEVAIDGRPSIEVALAVDAESARAGLLDRLGVS
jgi:inosine-uridine nucleoside N-ribohydrolase